MIARYFETREEWLDWRLYGIGGSDAPAIMLRCPWDTPLTKWEEKTKRREGKAPNWAQKKGIELEPKARADYELKTGIEMTPICGEHEEYPFIRVSLDGRNVKKRRAVEIKFAGKDDHQMALDGVIPEKYQWQLHHALFVTGDDVIDYYSYNQERGVIVPFERDETKLKELFAAERKFWDLVLTDTPPEFTERDFKLIRDPNLVQFFEHYKACKLEADRAEKALAEAKKQLLEINPNERVRCAGVQMMPITRKGNVDFSKVPELSGVDLEMYRKKPTQYVDIRLT